MNKKQFSGKRAFTPSGVKRLGIVNGLSGNSLARVVFEVDFDNAFNLCAGLIHHVDVLLSLQHPRRGAEVAARFATSAYMVHPDLPSRQLSSANLLAKNAISAEVIKHSDCVPHIDGKIGYKGIVASN